MWSLRQKASINTVGMERSEVISGMGQTPRDYGCAVGMIERFSKLRECVDIQGCSCSLPVASLELSRSCVSTNFDIPGRIRCYPLSSSLQKRSKNFSSSLHSSTRLSHLTAVLVDPRLMTPSRSPQTFQWSSHSSLVSAGYLPVVSILAIALSTA